MPKLSKNAQKVQKCPIFLGEKLIFLGEEPIFLGEKPIFLGEKPVFRGEKPILLGEKPILPGDQVSPGDSAGGRRIQPGQPGLARPGA